MKILSCQNELPLLSFMTENIWKFYIQCYMPVSLLDGNNVQQKSGIAWPGSLQLNVACSHQNVKQVFNPVCILTRNYWSETLSSIEYSDLPILIHLSSLLLSHVATYVWLMNSSGYTDIYKCAPVTL